MKSVSLYLERLRGSASFTDGDSVGSAFFVKEYFPVPSSGGNQCKNRHAAIWHFG